MVGEVTAREAEAVEAAMPTGEELTAAFAKSATAED